jgi:hypothetical protein
MRAIVISDLSWSLATAFGGSYIQGHVVAYPFGAFLAQPAGRFHPTLSANSRRQSARRAGLAA